MHVPDGFLDAPTSDRDRRGRGRRRGAGTAGRPARARRPYGAAGRARRGVRLRHPDAQLPGRVRHERPPARRCPRRDPRRPVHRAPLHGDGVPRAVPALRRRRHHRPRHQHRPDGRDHRRGRLDGLQDAPGGAPQAALDGGAVGRDRGAASRCRPRPWASCSSTRSAAPPTSPSTTWSPRWSAAPLIGIGEAAIIALAMPDRRGPARPRVRRPAGPREARARCRNAFEIRA